MGLTEVRPGLWAWPEVGAPDRVVEAAARQAGDAELVVIDEVDGESPRLGAFVFVTAAGKERLGESADHLGSLAPLDYWFTARASHAAIYSVAGESCPDSVRDASVLELTELVYRHLGYLPVGWATAAAVLDGDRSAVDFLQAYNYSMVAHAQMSSSIEPEAAHTLHVCEQLGLESASHCQRAVTRDEIVMEESVPRKVGPQFWAFDRPWYRAQRTKWHGLIAAELQDIRPFVIAGNGPSLRDSLPDISAMADQVRLVTSNFAVLEPAVHASSHVHTVVNYMVAEQAAGLINLLPERVRVVVPFWLSYCVRPRSNVFFTETTADLRFSTDIAKEVSWVHTVSFYAMQLAAGLSAGDVGLVGFDHSYDQPADVDEGAEVVDTGPDTNHFRNDYFSGKRWQAADTNMMETVYRLADEAYGSDSRRLVNCTIGGELELFARMPLRKFVTG